jgi:glycosyltransferase involved in cell wall biosynthesis
MKVLYIGHYKERGGWSEAARNYILALNGAGLNVVCRNVTLTQDTAIPIEIQRLESKTLEGVDVCIQHVLPHHLVGTTGFKKNIAYFVYDSLGIEKLSWLEHLKLMDEVWVPSSDLQKELTGLNINTKLVPHCFDMDVYTQKYPELNIPQAKNKFKFYYVGEVNDRKNLRCLIRCFHSEFDKTDNAVLILKVNKFGYDSQKLTVFVDQMIQEEKAKLKYF